MKLLFFFSLIFILPIGFAQDYNEFFKAVAFDRESEDRLGWSVAMDGDYAFVGAYADDFGATNPNMGSVYVFHKVGTSDWEYSQKLTHSDQEDYDRFGWSIAIHGDYAVIGAYAQDFDEDGGAELSKAGAAYIFELGADGMWTEMQKIVASDRDEDDEFGWSVDIYDETIVVGAHHEAHNEFGFAYEFHAGSIYIFDLNEATDTWEESQKLVASDRTDDHVYPDGRPDPTDEDVADLFGGSVAIWGDYLIAGSHMHDYGPFGVGTGYLWNQGTAYIFERSGGTWTEVQKIQSNIRKAWDRFGYAVDLDSNVAVIGVHTEDEDEDEADGLMNAGATYIFERDAFGTWEQTQKLAAFDRSAGDHFGRDVAIDDDQLVIGAEQEDVDVDGDDFLEYAGAAYFYEKNDLGTWEFVNKVDASDRGEGDYLGEAVAIYGRTAIVGAWQQDLNEEGLDYTEDAGAAYFYTSITCEDVSHSQSITICEGESFDVGGSTYTSTGIYMDVLPTAGGCDSTVTTDLVVLEPLLNTEDVSICFGSSYEIGTSTYDETGTYTDVLESAAGCDSVVITNLIVEDAISWDQEIMICEGGSVVVGGSVYTEPGDYEDILTAADGCDSTVYTTVEFFPAIDVSIEFEDELTMSGGDPDAEATYQWIKCDPYEVIDGATDQTYTATENGEYAVIITEGECSDTSDCVTISTVSIADYANNELKVYPNPNNGQFTIELNQISGNTQASLINALGAIVYKQNIINDKTMVNTENLAAGIYTLKITNGDQIIVRQISIE